ncbi:MAG: FtsX-like permease family protein [Gemmatimonadetes bacterium]|nr:FtsX-like permease family protein [Gemmatimonadota bacterium]MYG86259.1 FtsX-like permease family protein [Gemmatimonadota bacterium]MYJ90241.1 FtsX-like permease family protein [Gemmatimonadota bacterium]
MFRNYLTIAYRNALRHKGYALINVMGLAVGMTCCILILLYVQNELGYDRYASRHDRIYRLTMAIETPDRAETRTARSPTAWGWMLTDAFPEVEGFTRIKAPLVSWQVTYVEGNRRFNEPGFYFADPGILDLFDFNLVRGDANTALNAPNTVVMTESTAARYFGDEDALGKVIRIDNTYDLTVTGVMEDVPRNSHMTFGFLGSFETLNVNPIYGGTDYGRNTQNFGPDLYTYLLLAEGIPPESLDPKLAEFIESRYGPALNQFNAQIEAELQPLTSIHLHSNLDGELGANSDIAYIYIFSAVAFFLLLIACINFMNLATARSAGRAREVGIRKVLGAFRVQLIGQFMGESTIMAVISLFLAVGLVYAFLPAFNALAGKVLVFAFDDMSMAFGLIGIVVLAGALAGSYPALFLSSFQPVSVLKGSSRAGTVNTNLRKILVVLQFVISVVFIIGTGAVADQMRFVQDKHLGFDKEQLVVMPLGDPRQRLIYNAYKDQISSYPNVLGVTVANEMPGGLVNDILFTPDGAPEEELVRINNMWIDHDFIRTMNIELTAGRDFSRSFPTDTLQAFVINEAAVKWLGWEGAPLDKKIRLGNFKDGRVIGVVRDFHVRSLHSGIEPMMLQLAPGPDPLHYLAIRIAPDDVAETMGFLENSWREIYPDDSFTYSFLDEDFNRLYQNEVRQGSIFRSFSLLAVFIACLGLLGLASFTAEQRTREIGVRKVLGASASGIVALLSKEYVRLVVYANLIAWPIAYFVMNDWLDGFAYRTDLSPWIFVLAAALAIAVTMLTVSYRAVSVAHTDPVDALQHE